MTNAQRAAERVAEAEFIRLAGRHPTGWEFLEIASALQHGAKPEEAARDAAELAGEAEMAH